MAIRSRNQAKFTAIAALVFVSLGTPERAEAIAGLEGTFEFGLDAPWRIEPTKRADGTIEYGAIPIQITIHDALDAARDDVFYSRGQPAGTPPIKLPSSLLSLGQFESVRIREMNARQGLQGLGSVKVFKTFPVSSLYEIERTAGAWPWPAGARPRHDLCRIWAGEDPERCTNVSRTSEWHATLWYTPENLTPGTYVTLEIEVVLRRPTLPGAVSVNQPRIPNPLKNPAKDVAVGPGKEIDTSERITLRNYVRVYLAPDPLPRFDNRWLYGDFHYHSQGTDNEGEAAYNYRGVVRAMGAMGLDFVFATDHASNSEQIIDADLPPIKNIAAVAERQGNRLKESDAKSTGGVLRDMSPDRYAFSHGLIYGDKGVNKEAAIRGSRDTPNNYLSHGVMPQIFLGGEVDVVPEVKVSTIRANTVGTGTTAKLMLPYANGLKLDLGLLCQPLGCNDPRRTLLAAGDAESYVLRDFQSLESFQFFGREHLVYFPNAASLNVGGDTAFISSGTSRFGGATRRLDGKIAEQRLDVFGRRGGDPLLPELERKGVAFVAHHLNAGGSRGPDGIPWTMDHMLLKAFRSPAILGLEFWNEDTRNVSRVCSHFFCRDGADGTTYLGREEGYERDEKINASTFNPIKKLFLPLAEAFGAEFVGEFRNIALPLEEVRRGFVTGGARGGQFELFPFDVAKGKWQSTADSAARLAHGAFDWDRMNLRGLSFEQNTDLKWLKPREPRRVFMGGGSDAHGDFNYRRAGYFLGTDDANDTAIGKPRNLVFAGRPTGEVIYRDPARGDVRAYSQEQIVNALRRGRFSVTDGPAIRIAIDRNGNNRIDDNDVHMGDVLDLSSFDPASSTVTLLTEVISTPEFGPVVDIDVYVGAQPDPARPGAPAVEPRVYAPLAHGPTERAAGVAKRGYTSNGFDYNQRTDNYWAGESLADVRWDAVPGEQRRHTMTLATTLQLDRYEVGQGVRAHRFFVRAFTHAAAQDGNRYGYSNPIWIVRSLPKANVPTTVPTARPK